jgi:serine phosphatase RsbU (regulator of sigma subunit)
MTIQIRLLFVITFFSFFISKNAHSQNERGTLPIVNYSPGEYRGASQNWSIIQDQRGIMYFGNNAGVLEYDGENWRKIRVTNESIVRSLAIDTTGRIFVGAQDEFGYLHPNEQGDLVYKSLTDLLNDENKAFGDIWRIQILSNKIYFQSAQKIFEYDFKSKIIVHSADTKFHRLFLYNKKLLVKQKDKGLCLFNNNKLELLKGGEKFSQTDIVDILEIDKDSGIIVTSDGILFNFSITSNNHLILSVLSTELSIYNTRIGSATVLKSNRIVVSVNGIGLFVLGYDGKILQKVTEENGLQSNIVNRQYFDKHKNLWVALSDGISKIEINSPVTHLGTKEGIRGTIESIIRVNGELYFGGNLGLYNWSPSIEKVSQVLKDEVWHLNAFKLLDKETLIVSLSDSIVEIDVNNKIKRIILCEPWMTLQSKKAPERIYIADESGLISIRWNGFSWVQEEKIKEIDAPIRHIMEDDNGIIWLATNNNTGVISVDFTSQVAPQIKFYNDSNGIPVNGFSFAFEDYGKIYFATAEGVFSFFKPDSLIKDTEKWKNINSLNFGIHRMIKDKNGNFYVIVYSEEDQDIFKISKKGDIIPIFKREVNIDCSYCSRKQDNEAEIKKVTNYISHAVYPDSNDIVWIGGTHGAFKYVDSLNYHSNLIDVSIRKVNSKDHLFYFGGSFFNHQNSLLNHQIVIPSLNFESNSIKFEFACHYYDEKWSNSYKYFLEGFDIEWSDWKSETKTFYNNLPEGDYIFKVKAKNTHGIESDETTFKFTILPPWYRTIWAYFGYVLLLGGFVYGAVTFSTRSLKAIIKERTAEVVKQKELVEHKNKDIMDSINYAQRIQRAILPTNELLTTKLKETFVLYQPKDVVSGDFYWYTEKGKDVFVAVADCTGHGVPGAFMSMIGSSMLNHAVNEQGVIEAGEILSVVHKGIRHSLKQEETQNRDGMDIALLRFTINDSNEIVKLQYAGANRPIWFFRNGELGEIKATKSSIGGHTSEDQIFTSNEVEFDKGDVFYIFSDGYPDQFGGEKGKKLTTKKLKDLLMLIYKDSMSKQKDHLDKAFSDWKGENEQVDDVCFIGVRV